MIPRRDISARRAPALQAGAAVTLPLVVAAGTGDARAGAVATLGALAVLYPARVAAAGTAMVLAAAVGTAGAAGGALTSVLAIAVVAAIAAAWARLRAVPPPGPYMPVLVCATTTQIPLEAIGAPGRLALVAAGAAGAWVVVRGAGLFGADPNDPAVPARQPGVRRAALRAGAGTGTAALLAVAVGLPRPDWAAAACAAVLVQDGTRATLRRAGQRALGTGVGVGVAGAVLVVAPGLAATIVLVAVLQTAVELLVVRSYATAVVLITPLSLLIGELAVGGGGAVHATLAARLLETALGCTVAVAAQLTSSLPSSGNSGVARRPFRPFTGHGIRIDSGVRRAT